MGLDINSKMKNEFSHIYNKVSLKVFLYEYNINEILLSEIGNYYSVIIEE